MSLVLDEMGRALIHALKPGTGEPLLTQIARYRKHLVQTRFYEKCDEEERQWAKQQRREQMMQSKSKGFKDRWHKES